ncbi:MAG TPA: LytR C-terminal domain-containing protein [Longimicrobiales bacterium]|nr:LytR C-terminal domain-containing protein [Longimicrobiales bacterium]
MKADRRTSTALYIALGLVGAFLVSFVAGLPAPTEDEDDVAARNIGSPADVTVEVLNGAGVSGLAGSITDQLRSAGFDVVYFGNAARFDHAHSFVLDRVGNPDRARAVAAVLGIDSVATARDSTLLLDVSVVLGQDWPPEPETPDRVVDRALDLLDRD